MIRNLVFILAIFISCNIPKNSQLGKLATYKFKDSNTGVVGKILLHPNNDFSFEYTSGLVTQESKGKWSERENKIILQSNYSYKTGYIKTKSEEFSAKDSMKVKVLFENTNIEIPLVGVTINGKYSGVTNTDGTIRFEKVNTEKIMIDYLGENYYQYYSEQYNGDLTVFLNEKDASKKYFDESEWVKKGKKLLSPDGRRYKRTNN
jgi:hypothetical protein